MYWEQNVLNAKPHDEVEIPRQSWGTLQSYGYYCLPGLPVGQQADYRRALADGRSVHIRDYGDKMTAHWDRVDPLANLVGHLIADAPLLTVGILLALAVYVGKKGVPIMLR